MASGNKTPYADLHKDINSEKKALDIWTSHGTTKVIISGPTALRFFRKYLIEKPYFFQPFKSDLMRCCDALFFFFFFTGANVKVFRHYMKGCIGRLTCLPLIYCLLSWNGRIVGVRTAATQQGASFYSVTSDIKAPAVVRYHAAVFVALKIYHFMKVIWKAVNREEARRVPSHFKRNVDLKWRQWHTIMMIAACCCPTEHLLEKRAQTPAPLCC